MIVADTLVLVCHPATPTAAVRGITVRVRRSAAATLELGFVLDGDLRQLRIPSVGPPLMGQDLWRHTCFEAFVGVADARAYHELNLAPSSAWAVLGFRGYRDGGPLADVTLAPDIVVQPQETRLELDARMSLHSLGAEYAHAALRVGLAAVVEETSGALSYWALRHPPGRPDFHHDDAFALRLEPPPGAC